MFSLIRAGVFAALVTLASIFCAAMSVAADKPFERADLAEAAIKLEAQIKSEAGAAGKPLAQIRREPTLRSNATTSATAWCCSASSWPQRRPTARAGCGSRAPSSRSGRPTSASAHCCSSAPAPPPTRPTRCTKNRGEEADSLLIVGRTQADLKKWRPALDALRLSLEIREVADVRALYESMRSDHGFRMLDYSVDADAASPRACFQFSETLPAKRTDFSPFVAVAGIDKPALSAEQKQLCVEGLKHGERYSVTLRAGLPSTVQETLAKSAELSIYVRDRTPLVRFSAKAYVLPRTGQRGIPVVTVNTRAVNIEIYRIGDRNLLDTVLGNDFQRNLDGSDVERLAEDKRRQRLEGRARRRADAQRRGHHRVPGRSGGRRSCARRLCDDRDPPPARSRSAATTISRRNGSSSPTSGSRPIRATTASTCSSIRWPPPSRRARSKCG